MSLGTPFTFAIQFPFNQTISPFVVYLKGISCPANIMQNMELAFCKALRKICNFVFIQRQVSFHLSPNSQFSRWKIIKSRNKKMRFLLLLPLITIQSSSLLCKHLSFARCSKHIFARLPSCFWNLKLRLSKLSLYIRWACAQNSL